MGGSQKEVSVRDDQNRIFTAEAPKTQKKHFSFGGRYRQTRRFPSFQCKLRNRRHRHQEASVFFPKACLPAGRDGVFDPIAVSRLDQKNTPLSDLCGSAVSLILKGAHAIKEPNGINRSRNQFWISWTAVISER
jgi:hypothetical protein